MNEQPKENGMETGTKQTLQSEELVGTRAALAKVVPIDESRIDYFNPKRWTASDIDLIKQTVCPKGIPDADFKLFIAKCQASGMNPMLGEAFCVDRNQNIGTKDSPKWIKVYVFTPGEQGMEARADDFPDFRGLRAAAVYEKDAIIIDPSKGEVSHQYNPVGDRGKLMGAWAIADREGRKTPVEYVRFDEYYDSRNPQWNARPATMIVKCARAASLRRAYPNKFDGIFAREELRDDGGESEPTPAQAQQANRDTTDKLADRMLGTAQAQESIRPGAVSVPPGQRTVDVVVEKPKASPPKPVQKATGMDKLAADPQSFMNEPSPQDIAALVQKLKAANIGFDETKLTVRAYFDEQTSKLAQAVKVATGSDVQRAGPPPVDDSKDPLVTFKPWKDKRVSQMSGPELLEAILYGEKNLAAAALRPAQTEAVRWMINILRASEKAREAKLLEEPGASEKELF